MLETILQAIIDVCTALPETIAGWFNLTNTDALFLQFAILLLPILALVLKRPLSWANEYQGFKHKGFTKREKIVQIIFAVTIILLYDKVLGQDMSSAMREALDLGDTGRYIIFALIAIIMVMALIRAVLVCLSMFHSCINLLLFGKSRQILSGYRADIPVRFKISAGIICYALGDIMEFMTILLGAVVFCYNYCV